MLAAASRRSLPICVLLFAVALLGAPYAAAQETAPNGKIAYASAADGDSDIYTVNPDGTELVNLTDAFGAAEDTDPNWSPDGSKIAFASSRAGHDENVLANNVFVMNADGSDQLQLTFDGAFEASFAPSWSPDGTQLAFTSDRDGDRDIFTMGADGADQTNVTGPNQSLEYEDLRPDWSPDGTRIIFEGVREGAWEILSANPDGTGELNLTPEDDPPWANVNGYASYRPDGTKIVFMRAPNDGSDDWDIWVMDPDGTDKENIVPDDEWQDLAPTWSPDGNRILFYSNRSELDFDLFTIDYPPVAPAQATADPSMLSAEVQQITTDGDAVDPDWGTSSASVPSCQGRAATKVGTRGPDTFVGDSQVDIFVGLGGADKVRTAGGGDYVCAGAGRDIVRGDAGNDHLFGQGDNDQLRGGEGRDELVGGSGTDVCVGGAGTDSAQGCESTVGP
jgi:dipeptidyl aminopeptidase/acylaminoacyl peptidase